MKTESREPMLPDYSISIEVEGKKRKRIKLDLSTVETAILGELTANWAYLEHAIFVATAIAAEQAGVGLPADAVHDSFKRRFKAFQEILNKHRSKVEYSSVLQGLVSKIANLQTHRHRITHGIWSYSRGDARKIIGSSFRPGREFEHPYDHKRLVELADEIAEVNFWLTYPNGEWLPSGSENYAYVHRSLLMPDEDRERLYPEFRTFTASPFVKKDEQE